MIPVNNVLETIYCFRTSDFRKTGRPDAKVLDKTRSDPERTITCKVCGYTITAEKHAIAIDGSHSHTYFNPAGIVFELGAFRQAPGCQVFGEPTKEFTWFAGYLWQFAVCRQCKEHLGWYYIGATSDFFGLILTKLNRP